MPEDIEIDELVLSYGEYKIRLQEFTIPYHAYLFVNVEKEKASQDFDNIESALRAWADNCLDWVSWDGY